MRDLRRAVRSPAWRLPAVLLLAALALRPLPARAAMWYEDYLDGIKAINEGRPAEAVKRLQAALASSSKAQLNKKTYGMRFEDYLPQFYLGLAYLDSGNASQALRYLEEAEQDGTVLRSSQSERFRDALRRAKASAATPVAKTPPPTPTAIVERATPTPTPRTPTPTPTPKTPTPATPTPATPTPATPTPATPTPATPTPRTPPPTPTPTPATPIPDDTAARLADARDSLRGDRYEEARDRLRRILDRRPDNAEALRLLTDAESKLSLALGRSLERQGRLPEALSAYQAAARRDPGNHEAAEAEAALRQRMATPALAPTQVATAVPVPSRAPAPPPPSDELRRGLTLLFQGDTAGSIRTLEALLAASSGDPDLHAYLGVAYARAGLGEIDAKTGDELKEKARGQFREARRLRSDYELSRRLTSPSVRELFRNATP